jgi:hypothetical protein
LTRNPDWFWLAGVLILLLCSDGGSGEIDRRLSIACEWLPLFVLRFCVQVRTPSSRTFTVLHPGVGFGIRFKMNKYSDTNVAIDFAVDLRGSNGLFVNLGEVF